MDTYAVKVFLHHSRSDAPYPDAAEGHADVLASLVDRLYLDEDLQLTKVGVAYSDELRFACKHNGVAVNLAGLEILLHRMETEGSEPSTRQHMSARESLLRNGLLDEDGLTPQGLEVAQRAVKVDLVPGASLGY